MHESSDPNGREPRTLPQWARWWLVLLMILVLIPIPIYIYVLELHSDSLAVTRERVAVLESIVCSDHPDRCPAHAR